MNADTNQASFQRYKETEALAFRIAEELRAQNPKLVDIEISLIAAIFAAHRKQGTPPEQVAAIIKGHADMLIPFFSPPPENPEAPGRG